MRQKETRCINFWTGWICPIFFFLHRNIYIFSISYCPPEATEDSWMFPGRQIKCNLPLSSNTKIFTPRLLMHRIPFRSISECLNRFVIVVFKSLNCPQGEKMHLKIIQSLLERVQICKSCWKTEDPAGHGGFFWRTALSLTVQNLF